MKKIQIRDEYITLGQFLKAVFQVVLMQKWLLKMDWF